MAKHSFSNPHAKGSGSMKKAAPKHNPRSKGSNSMGLKGRPCTPTTAPPEGGTGRREY